MISLLFITPQRVVFEGHAKSIIVPGEEGVFEVLSYHKDCFSRLLPGSVIIDNKDEYPIRRGIIKVERNTAIVVAEQAH